MKKPRIHTEPMPGQTRSAKVTRREGNSPDHKIRHQMAITKKGRLPKISYGR